MRKDDTYKEFFNEFNASHGDQRTAQEKADGQVIDEEENIKRSSSRYHDASRNYDMLGEDEIEKPPFQTPSKRLDEINRELPTVTDREERMALIQERQEAIKEIHQERQAQTKEIEKSPELGR